MKKLRSAHNTEQNKMMIKLLAYLSATQCSDSQQRTALDEHRHSLSPKLIAANFAAKRKEIRADIVMINVELPDACRLKLVEANSPSSIRELFLTTIGESARKTLVS